MTETDDEGYLHIIIDIEGTCSNWADYEVLSGIQKLLVVHQYIPEKQYVDSGYISGPNLVMSIENGIELIGPACPVVSK